MKYLRKLFALLAASTAATLLATTAYAAASTKTVDTLDDELDGACPPGDCSLREAIAAASDGDTVTFDISLDGGTITLGGLGTVTVDKTVTIDGDIDGTAGPDITVNGTGVAGNAVSVTSASVTIDGLVISGGTSGGSAAVNVSGASFVLKNSMVNTNGTANTKDVPYAITLSAASAQIGTGTAGDGNTLGGGININNVSGTQVLGNYIGITSGGNNIVPATNPDAGITVSGASAITTTIGGSGSASRNIISNFSADNGIAISNSHASSTTNIYGNYIGTNVAGTAAAANQIGMSIASGVTGTVNIGSATAGQGNIISGNTDIGVKLETGNTATVTVKNNYIGTNATGAGAVANGTGIEINVCTAITLGDTVNVVSGNTGAGISIKSTSCTVAMSGAYVGLGADGSTTIANGTGIDVTSTGGSVAIGSSGGSVNVISGNTGVGVYVESTATITPTIRNNYIGLNSAGTAAKANGFSGIKLEKPANVYSNIISGNTGNGIQLTSTVTTSDIQANYIGLNAAGTSAVANGNAGIHVFGATGVAIGNNTVGANVISGNTQAGILISASGSATILNNKIGTNAAGTVTTVGNGNSFLSGSTIYYGGIMVQSASATIGSGTLGNTINGNYGQGVVAVNSATTLLGNTISSNIAGTTPGLANGSGVVIIDSVGGSSSSTVIGSTGTVNTINSNAEYGLSIAHQPGGGGISGITVYGNTIGAIGAGNTDHGIFIEDTTPGGNITNVTIGSTSGPNTITYNGGAGIRFNFMTSGTINSNTITNNTGVGVWAYASSPTISSNTISSNGSNGIKIEADYGVVKSPSVTADDVRSAPTATGNTLTSNAAADIYAIDSAFVNESTLHTDNTITNTSGINGIEQVWYGALSYTCNGSAVATGISSASVEGSSSSFTTYNGGYWGPTSFSYTDVTTWGQIKEFIYTSVDGKTTYTPHSITATPTSGAMNCSSGTGSDSFDGSSYYKTATVALTSIGGGIILPSSSSRSSRSTTTTDTTEEATEETREEITEEPAEEDISRETEGELGEETTYDAYEPETTNSDTYEPITRPEYTREDYSRTEPSEASSRTDTGTEETGEINTLVIENLDIDRDGITNVEELERGTNPNAIDTDGDGVSDIVEKTNGTDPTSAESVPESYATAERTSVDGDSDGLSDYVERYVYGTDPLEADSDNDGQSDGLETIFGGTNPTDSTSRTDTGAGPTIYTTFTTREGSPFAAFGTAAPNQEVTILLTSASGQSSEVTVTADENGVFIVSLTAEGGLTLSVKSPDGKSQIQTQIQTTKEETPDIKDVTITGLNVETYTKEELKALTNITDEEIKTALENNELNIPVKWTTRYVKGTETELPYFYGFIKNLKQYQEILALKEKGAQEDNVIKGYTTPGARVVIAMKSLITTSVVIADKDTGYFEVALDRETSRLKDGVHQLYIFAMNDSNGVTSPLFEMIFNLKRK